MASALLIWLEDDVLVNKFLGNKYLYYVGEISYSVYLLHWPAIVIFNYTLNADHLAIKGNVNRGMDISSREF